MVCVRAWGWCDVPCRPQGVVLGASQDPKTSHILGGKTVMWGTILPKRHTTPSQLHRVHQMGHMQLFDGWEHHTHQS